MDRLQRLAERLALAQQEKVSRRMEQGLGSVGLDKQGDLLVGWRVGSRQLHLHCLAGIMKGGLFFVIEQRLERCGGLPVSLLPRLLLLPSVPACSSKPRSSWWT